MLIARRPAINYWSMFRWLCVTHKALGFPHHGLEIMKIKMGLQVQMCTLCAYV
jgi:hypothetical protein